MLLSAQERERPAPVRLRLIATLFGRASNVMMVALAALICGAASYERGGSWLTLVVTMTEVALLLSRCGVILAFNRHEKAGAVLDPEAWLLRLGVLAIGSSLCWGALCFVGLATSHDPVLYVLPVLAAVGTAGAVAARNSGVPRLARLQLACSLTPILVGSLFADDHGFRLLLLLVPAMAAGLCILIAERNQQLVELIETQGELGRLSHTDSLTQMPNRRFFDARLASIAGTGKPFALLMIDVDHFKAFNDRSGHPAGDRLLQDIAAILNGRFSGDGNVVARYGGEEFAVLLENTDTDAAVAIGERVRIAVNDGGAVSISVGVAAGAGDPRRVVQEADDALYRAKRNGRNRVESSEPAGLVRTAA